MLLVPANGLWPSLITMKTYNQGLLCQELALRKEEKSSSGKGRAESTGGEGWQRERVILEFQFGVGKLESGSWCEGEGRNGWEEIKRSGRKIWMWMGNAFLF